MEKLLATQRTILEQFQAKTTIERAVYSQFNLTNAISGIVGSRGVGKTTFLLKTVIEQGAEDGLALYVTADDLYFLENKLIDLVDEIYKQTDIRFLCIDEIHKYPNWNQELKNIADIYPTVKILFSGSSMIDLVHSKYDLSRRVTLYKLTGLSFREFLKFDQDLDLPIFSYEDLLSQHTSIASDIKVQGILKHFNHYLKTGYYPFYKDLGQEYEIFQSIENIIQKTIYEDIATFHQLKTQSLVAMEKIYKYVIYSSPGELNINKLASAIGNSFDATSQFLSYLTNAGLIRQLHAKPTGKKTLKSPKKMFPENTNCLYAYYLTNADTNMLGKLRETFMLCQLENSHHAVHYTDIGDINVDNTYIEIGGKNKISRQLKNHTEGYVAADNIEIGFNNKIPLYLFGFLY